MKIVISGTTGVGKSTTVNLLSQKLTAIKKDVKVKGELVLDSPYFDLFFNNLPEWGMLSQLDFVLERFNQYFNEFKKNENKKDEIIIFDRLFIEDLAFSELKLVKQNTSKMLSNVYKNVYYNLLNTVIAKNGKVDYFILLKASFETVMDRMNKRGREIEKKFNEEYWQDLYYRYYSKRTYKEIFKQFSNNFIELDIDDKTPEEVVDTIIKYIKKRKKI